ncbi:YegP family protein [Kitasatospora sp. NPDC059327]|uniref:YegP family protein n=1 Tax=Kitasatospora sp. NPDC059327 TaxID=3346803 RepID=UPI003684485D
MAGRFELYTDESGMHRFRLKASNGTVVVTGDPQETRDDCVKSIESLRKLAPYAELKETAAGPA